MHQNYQIGDVKLDVYILVYYPMHTASYKIIYMSTNKPTNNIITFLFMFIV